VTSESEALSGPSSRCRTDSSNSGNDVQEIDFQEAVEWHEEVDSDDGEMN
jgi:hypothetical protein